jgi:TetR/AcrR family transcriptional regulator, repressor of fatR-cypB operon
MNRALAERPTVVADKRGAILSAALRLIARSGLHNTPMSAIARDAGVAAGTLYIYFRSKEELINGLYLELVRDRMEAITRAHAPDLPVSEQLWRAWSSFAHWHLEHRDASNFIQQCESSGILSEETLALRSDLELSGRENYAAAVDEGLIREMPIQVFHALFSGPILVLAQLRDKQEIDVDDQVLKLTFDGVRRSLLRSTNRS